jgi:hypothetical protein
LVKNGLGNLALNFIVFLVILPISSSADFFFFDFELAVFLVVVGEVYFVVLA